MNLTKDLESKFEYVVMIERPRKKALISFKSYSTALSFAKIQNKLMKRGYIKVIQNRKGFNAYDDLDVFEK